MFLRSLFSFYTWITMEGSGCSIEMEPRTLNGGELKSARVAAEDIIQNKDQGEASSIFTEGMRAVISIKGMEKEVEKRDQIHKLVEVDGIHEAGSWEFHCSETDPNPNPNPNPAIEECCDAVIKIREPLSSPF